MSLRVLLIISNTEELTKNTQQNFSFVAEKPKQTVKGSFYRHPEPPEGNPSEQDPTEPKPMHWTRAAAARARCSGAEQL